MGGWGLCIAKNMIHLSYEDMDVSFMVQLLSTKYSLKVVKDASFIRLMKHTDHSHSTNCIEKNPTTCSRVIFFYKPRASQLPVVKSCPPFMKPQNFIRGFSQS